MKYILSSTAISDLKKIDKNVRKKIFQKLDFYVSTPNPIQFTKHLTDSSRGDYRFRIGDWRATFDIENNTIYILHIDHRRTVYKK